MKLAKNFEVRRCSTLFSDIVGNNYIAHNTCQLNRTCESEHAEKSKVLHQILLPLTASYRKQSWILEELSTTKGIVYLSIMKLAPQEAHMEGKRINRYMKCVGKYGENSNILCYLDSSICRTSALNFSPTLTYFHFNIIFTVGLSKVSGSEWLIQGY